MTTLCTALKIALRTPLHGAIQPVMARTVATLRHAALPNTCHGRGVAFTPKNAIHTTARTFAEHRHPFGTHAQDALQQPKAQQTCASSSPRPSTSRLPPPLPTRRPLQIATESGEGITVQNDTRKFHPVSPEQAKNILRFERKLLARSNRFHLYRIPGNGIALQADIPARNIPGSKATYESQIDAAGVTKQFTKITYAPDGHVVHLKDKIQGFIVCP